MTNNQKSQNKTYKISGLDCASCASLIEMDLEDAGYNAVCSYQKQTLQINGDHDVQKVQDLLKKSGYNIEK